MKHILIVGSARSAIASSISPALRVAQPGLVNCYFGNELGKLLGEGIEWQEKALLLLALSDESQNKNSMLFKAELAILHGALRFKVPIGIICDKHGRVTAPHLDEVSEAVSIVVADSANPGCELGGFYPNAEICTPENGTFNAQYAAELIAKLIPSQKTMGEKVGIARRKGPPRLGETIDIDNVPFSSDARRSSW